MFFDGVKFHNSKCTVIWLFSYIPKFLQVKKKLPFATDQFPSKKICESVCCANENCVIYITGYPDIDTCSLYNYFELDVSETSPMVSVKNTTADENRHFFSLLKIYSNMNKIFHR